MVVIINSLGLGLNYWQMSWSSTNWARKIECSVRAHFPTIVFCMLIPVGLIIKMEDVKAEADGQAFPHPIAICKNSSYSLRCKVVWKRHATPHLLLNVILNVYQTLKRTLLHILRLWQYLIIFCQFWLHSEFHLYQQEVTLFLKLNGIGIILLWENI